jgi:hypothetical protein
LVTITHTATTSDTSNFRLLQNTQPMVNVKKEFVNLTRIRFVATMLIILKIVMLESGTVCSNPKLRISLMTSCDHEITFECLLFMHCYATFTFGIRETSD